MGGHWLAELDGRRVTVDVPASSANLGAGYDCLGVALDLTNRVELEVRGWSRGEIELTVDGEGQGELTDDRDNRFVQGLEAALREARGELPDGVGWRITMHNAIPLARGLGSWRRRPLPGWLRRTRWSAAPWIWPRSCASRPPSRAIPTMPRPPCSAGSWCRRPRRTG